MIRMRTTPNEAQRLIRQIPHNSCQSALERCWIEGGDAGVTHEWARKARYQHGDIESELAVRLSDVDVTSSLNEAGLETAIALAVKTHLDQTDKAGEPYILHPLRVMFRLSSGNERIVGVLHDVVEDSEVSFNDLGKIGFSDIVIDALKAVTKLPAEKGSDEGYQAFVERAGANPIARQVKIADLMDNLDVTRLEEIGEKDSRRISKYLRALRYLEKRLPPCSSAFQANV